MSRRQTNNRTQRKHVGNNGAGIILCAIAFIFYFMFIYLFIYLFTCLFIKNLLKFKTTKHFENTLPVGQFARIQNAATFPITQTKHLEMGRPES